ncbi:hypothetical protein [Culicoidibacter larvae]|uniref:DUF3139 domain-containing protein n=1 Tax=Culicoidibacter larvae TaxID=2579976 RepID=A0A5R8QCJ9_9FIRM|nr:hypothetical protein [Culicoidibacter larvae]TLG74301.1 hypothetical protein FEZ08_06230 [Culicoidibacter larvae]
MKKYIVIAIITSIIVITSLWVTKIIPRQISIFVAEYYVSTTYPDYNLVNIKSEEFSAEGGYLITFIDSSNTKHNFLVTSTYLPIHVSFDPILNRTGNTIHD